jgi:hypothetical protein
MRQNSNVHCHFPIQEPKMAYSQQGVQRGFENQGDDLRTLAAVLQDIMPALARIQTRSPQAPSPGPLGPISVETAAAVALVSDLGADSLRRLTAYLDANAGKFGGLENCVPLATAAAQALAARDYARSFTMLFDIYRTIALLRTEDPKLPLPGSIKNVSSFSESETEDREGNSGKH